MVLPVIGEHISAAIRFAAERKAKRVIGLSHEGHFDGLRPGRQQRNWSADITSYWQRTHWRNLGTDSDIGNSCLPTGGFARERALPLDAKVA